ncbi:MAG: right-handed parallel beta-helix repeat-containing protein, partial [Gammaproteobacteria bacterium]|nr:right-handed parallel beta-helix repeat-containing protein [Gammaproteobacteria bacterium]
YVDPSIAGDSGAGTSGDPYGDLEYAIEQTTFDTTNGTRVNIKAGTDEVVAVELSAAMADTVTTIAWVPSATAPCVFQGYTTSAADGGIGGISGGGSVSVYADAAFNFVHFIDLHCHNCGSSVVLLLNDDCSVIGCEIDNTTGMGIDLDNSNTVINNHIHNVGDEGVRTNNDCYVAYNYLENGTNKMTTAILVASTTNVVERNIISLDSTSDGINGGNNAETISHNSIWSNGGTGQGIIINSNRRGIRIYNNIVEGFSGSGGIGFDLDASGVLLAYFAGNASYDNATHYANLSTHISVEVDNETLSASPFTDAANGDFSPVDTGNVKEGSYPGIVGDG